LLDYIPAVGDIDAFIKIPRPDEVEDNLGLTVLDEPSAKQSDPTILGMQLRNDAKDVITSDAPVKKLDRADKNTREIEQWVTNIK
uniref:Intraflagellar transport protein 46 homolog n=1 Tax=Anisakis simplex TaxID=6269 RepID=A0A0M3JHD0_ANISI